MSYTAEDYTKHYIVTALFKLMNVYEYENIRVKEIAEKAGVGRATFYRYFKSKEDVIVYYFEHNTREFVFGQRIYPRCKDDYIKVATDVLTMFKNNLQMEGLVLLAERKSPRYIQDKINSFVSMNEQFSIDRDMNSGK